MKLGNITQFHDARTTTDVTERKGVFVPFLDLFDQISELELCHSRTTLADKLFKLFLPGILIFESFKPICILCSADFLVTLNFLSKFLYVLCYTRCTCGKRTK